VKEREEREKGGRRLLRTDLIFLDTMRPKPEHMEILSDPYFREGIAPKLILCVPMSNKKRGLIFLEGFKDSKISFDMAVRIALSYFSSRNSPIIFSDNFTGINLFRHFFR
jgi:hypothetical protein